MVCKFQSRDIGRRVFEINDYQLLVLVRWNQQRRLSTRFEAEKIAVLSLHVSAAVRTSCERPTYIIMCKD